MTFTHLTLGEPRLKGTPRGDAPCSDPQPTSKQWTIDGSFENLFDITGPDPGGNDRLPEWWGSSGWQWAIADGGADVAYAPYGQEIGTGSGSPFVSTANPHSGTSHLRQTGTIGSGSFNSLTWAASHVPCDTQAAGGGSGTHRSLPIAVRANPGTLITTSIWIDGSTTGGTLQYRWDFAGYDYTNLTQNHFTFVPASYTSFTTGSYVQISNSLVVPAGDELMAVGFAWRQSGAGTWTVDLDDWEITTS